jgi:hypothetical protein
MATIQALRYSLDRLKKEAARRSRRVETRFHWPTDEEEHQALVAQYGDDPRVLLVLPELHKETPTSS